MMARGTAKLVLISLIVASLNAAGPLPVRAQTSGGQATRSSETGPSVAYPRAYRTHRAITITDRRVIKNGSTTGTYNQVPAVVEMLNGDYLLSYNVGLDHVTTYWHVLRRSHDKGNSWSAELDRWSATSLDPTLARAPLSGDILISFAKLDSDNVMGAAYARADVHGHNWSSFTFFDNPVTDTFSTPTQYLVDGVNMYASGYDGEVVNANFWLSSDDGYTWTKVSIINQPGDANLTETGIAQIGPTTLLAISRDDVDTHTWGHVSQDMGLTWGTEIDYTPQVGALALPQLLQIKNALLLFGRDSGANALVVFASYDNGKTFIDRTVLDTYTGENIDGGYSWPLLRRDGRIFVVYYADSEGLRKPDIKSLILQWN